ENLDGAYNQAHYRRSINDPGSSQKKEGQVRNEQEILYMGEVELVMTTKLQCRQYLQVVVHLETAEESFKGLNLKKLEKEFITSYSDQTEILETNNAFEIKQLGKLCIEEKWSQIKYNMNMDFGGILDSTGGRPIVEFVRDSFWGIGTSSKILTNQNDFHFLDRIDIGFIKLLKASLNMFISSSTQERPGYDSTYAIAINDNKSIKCLVGRPNIATSQAEDHHPQLILHLPVQLPQPSARLPEEIVDKII
uniref:Vitellogenin n=1 Tax=Romanomermis culicivorax TaxID=13658 RepID=A0A915L6F1_ROMCU